MDHINLSMNCCSSTCRWYNISNSVTRVEQTQNATTMMLIAQPTENGGQEEWERAERKKPQRSQEEHRRRLKISETTEVLTQLLPTHQFVLCRISCLLIQACAIHRIALVSSTAILTHMIPIKVDTCHHIQHIILWWITYINTLHNCHICLSLSTLRQSDIHLELAWQNRPLSCLPHLISQHSLHLQSSSHGAFVDALCPFVPVFQNTSKKQVKKNGKMGRGYVGGPLLLLLLLL